MHRPIALSESHPLFIRRDDAVFVFVDIQEVFAPHIDEMDRVVKGCRTLGQAATRMELPRLLTEQYPKGLGRTVDPVMEVLPGVKPIEKSAFSCCGETRFMEALEDLGRKSVVICGIEAQVCVLQTILDLRGLGYDVWAVVDAISSRKPLDRETAFRQYEQAGAALTTCEAVLFQLLVDARNPDFKDVQAFVK